MQTLLVFRVRFRSTAQELLLTHKVKHHSSASVDESRRNAQELSTPVLHP